MPSVRRCTDCKVTYFLPESTRPENCPICNDELIYVHGRAPARKKDFTPPDSGRSMALPDLIPSPTSCKTGWIPPIESFFTTFLPSLARELPIEEPAQYRSYQQLLETETKRLNIRMDNRHVACTHYVPDQQEACRNYCRDLKILSDTRDYSPYQRYGVGLVWPYRSTLDVRAYQVFGEAFWKWDLALIAWWMREMRTSPHELPRLIATGSIEEEIRTHEFFHKIPPPDPAPRPSLYSDVIARLKAYKNGQDPDIPRPTPPSITFRRETSWLYDKSDRMESFLERYGDSRDFVVLRLNEARHGKQRHYSLMAISGHEDRQSPGAPQTGLPTLCDPSLGFFCPARCNYARLFGFLLRDQYFERCAVSKMTIFALSDS